MKHRKKYIESSLYQAWSSLSVNQLFFFCMKKHPLNLVPGKLLVKLSKLEMKAKHLITGVTDQREDGKGLEEVISEAPQGQVLGPLFTRWSGSKSRSLC